MIHVIALVAALQYSAPAAMAQTSAKPCIDDESSTPCSQSVQQSKPACPDSKACSDPSNPDTGHKGALVAQAVQPPADQTEKLTPEQAETKLEQALGNTSTRVSDPFSPAEAPHDAPEANLPPSFTDPKAPPAASDVCCGSSCKVATDPTPAALTAGGGAPDKSKRPMINLCSSGFTPLQKGRYCGR